MLSVQKGRTSNINSKKRFHIFNEIICKYDPAFVQQPESQKSQYLKDNLGRKSYYQGMQQDCWDHLGLQPQQIRNYGMDTFLNHLVKKMTLEQNKICRKIATNYYSNGSLYLDNKIVKEQMIQELIKQNKFNYRCLDRRLLTIAQIARKSLFQYKELNQMRLEVSNQLRELLELPLPMKQSQTSYSEDQSTQIDYEVFFEPADSSLDF